MGDPKRGLYQKFEVYRTDGSSQPGGKHEGCEYFVLDMRHDKHAKAAIAAYADSCESEYPLLARDLRGRINSLLETHDVFTVAQLIEDLNHAPTQGEGVTDVNTEPQEIAAMFNKYDRALISKGTGGYIAEVTSFEPCSYGCSDRRNTILEAIQDAIAEAKQNTAPIDDAKESTHAE